jgi:isopentenyl diphosphate isomerase/L-lactate dehydrogenase-like FMN-dependent dehydrogenase
VLIHSRNSDPHNRVRRNVRHIVSAFDANPDEVFLPNVSRALGTEPLTLTESRKLDTESEDYRSRTANNDFTLTFEDIEWLVGLTDLPVVLKGVLHPDDAIRAVACGVKGVVVSNHGGRQLDGSPPAIEVLPEIVAAVGDKVCIGCVTVMIRYRPQTLMANKLERPLSSNSYNFVHSSVVNSVI